jgi:hypothetical protein
LNNQEADKIIDRLKYSFTYNRFEEPGAISEYKRVLAKYSFEQMSRAVDTLIDTDKDGKNVPSIPALIKACKETRVNSVMVHNETHCDICNDKGYAFMTEITKIGETKDGKAVNLPYQYVLHCICPVGMAQAYEGKNCKKGEESPYRVPSITEYYDDQAISEIRKANKMHLTDEQKEEIQMGAARIGLKMPNVHGDAWEGDT